MDENETCKVSDFGLLREVPKDYNMYVSTYQGPSPLRWMAPESIKDKIFSNASDVWSYGILQWEMFNPEKEMPYHNLDDVQMILKVSEGYRMPIPRGCPGLAAKIMRACWQHEPRNRPSFLLISNLLTQHACFISESSLSGITLIGEGIKCSNQSSVSNKVYVFLGKFGKVYKAQMQAITVAVKVTKKYSSEKAMRDFQNQISIMREVAHQNIVRLYGIISEGKYLHK